MRNGMKDVRGREKREREFYRREELRRKRKAVQSALGIRDSELKRVRPILETK